MGGGEVLKKGWLIKSPPLEGSGLKSWRRRWFCLMSSKVLEYYKSAKHSELKGVINLEDCESLNVDLFHKKYKHVFDLRTKDRIYYLVASSSAEMESWVQIICRICNFSERLSAAESATDSLTRRNSSSLPATTRMTTKFSPVRTRDSFRTKFISPVESSEAERNSNYGMAQEAAAEVARMSEPPSEIPPGIPFTEALESKGLARRAQTSVGFSQPKPTIASHLHSRRVTSTNSPSHVSSRSFQEDEESSDDEHLYELPPDCMLPSSPVSSLEIPDHYDIPRSWNPAMPSSAIPISGSLEISTQGSERAHVLENGYMVPRLLMQQMQYNYDHVPSTSRPANGGKLHRSALLQEVSSPGTTSSSGGPPHSYINVRQLAEGDTAPPVDRSTKPSGPAVDRSLKPDRVGSEVSLSGYDIPDGETSHSEDSCSPSDFSVRSDGNLMNEAFASTDIPRLTSRSVQYIQVEFEKSRKPIPKPRSNPIKSPHAKPRVNYTDIDITATTANTEPSTAARMRTYDDLQETKGNSFENEADFYMEDGPDQMFISSPVHINKVRIPMEN